MSLFQLSTSDLSYFSASPTYTNQSFAAALSWLGSRSDAVPRTIAEHLTIAFPEKVSRSAHEPFFSVEGAPLWMSSFGYRLYLEQDDSVIPTTLWNPDEATTTQLKGLEEPETWVTADAFQAYMELTYGARRGLESQASPASSRAPSRAASSVSMADSRPSSRISFTPSSHASSPTSASEFAASEMPSRPSSSMSVEYTVEIHNYEASNPPSPEAEDHPALTLLPTGPILMPLMHYKPLPPPKTRYRGSTPPGIKLTRQTTVDRVLIYLVDLSASVELLKTTGGKILNLDTFIRAEESWNGSGGHTVCDGMVDGFDPDLTVMFKCRRIYLKCNGVDTCELINNALFANCERFEPDARAMRELWNHELDGRRARLAFIRRILSRFYNRIQASKCKVKYDGVPILVQLSHPSAYGKRFFVGCSKWNRAEKDLHNDGHLPSEATTENDKCILTVHPRVTLATCPYSHIINGQIRPAEIIHRLCPTRMIIFVPIDHEDSPATAYRALVVLKNAHNHPMHPSTKPRAEDRIKLRAAITAAGLTGLTVQTRSTSMLYGGDQIAENSPGFANSRKVRDFIIAKEKIEHPRGMGWEGVLYYLDSHEMKLPKHVRYLHTA
ncbi:hypothetical protein DFH09DRAFT_1345234 [Mycena vulgaris]|nr:hypothetical protein DFH09DRAFT_1345234 [Mycena vulgaris]